MNLKNFLPNLTEIMSVNADKVKKICAIYDWDAKGEIDMYYFMDIFYALGMNIIKKVTSDLQMTSDQKSDQKL